MTDLPSGESHQRPGLSVVVPAYNAEASIERCLSALVAALPVDGEIVVVDDASADATAAIAERFPVRLLRQEQNRGTSATRNAGMRLSSSELVCFVDADVEVRVDTLNRMRALLEQHPEIVGVNGILDAAQTASNLASDFVNTSIHFQHLRHGPRVRSAFTSACMLRRAALEDMGGWDERWFSRYADDVVTRFRLRERTIAMDPEIRVLHHKRVSLSGLLEHRYNVGGFFVRSCANYSEEILRAPTTAVLDLRYPLNTVAAAGYVFAGVATLGLGPFALPLWLLPAGVSGLANLRFVLFTLRHRGAYEAAAAGPLSVLEGFAYLGGMVAGLARTPGARG